MVSLYDETRVFDKGCFDAALDFLTARFDPSVFSRLFEPGVGTGRIAIPLVERGYQVTGVDISEDMLAFLKRRLEQDNRRLSLSLLQADVMRLPFRDAVFDIAVVVHLFYFIKPWQKAVNEILRVLKKDGPLILMHTGTGTEVPFLNARYRELCSEQGYLVSEIGVKSTSEVVDYLANLGCYIEEIRDRWRWIQRIPLKKALDYMRARAYSFTTLVPTTVHLSAMERLESEARQQYRSLAIKVEVPDQVYLVLVQRQ